MTLLTPTAGRIVLAAALLGLFVHAASSFYAPLVPFREIAYHGLLFGAGIACAARSVGRRVGRLSWGLVAIGLLAWAAGDLYWTTSLATLPEAPYPSLADAGWIVFYPLMYVAALLLLRESVTRVPLSFWLDGLLGALALTSLGLVLVFGPIFSSATEGSTAQIVTNMSYPTGDLLLLALTVVIFAVHGWRPGARWTLVAGGLVASAVVDADYLYRTTMGTYDEQDLMATLWPLSTFLFAVAAWQRSPRVRVTPLEGRTTAAMPTVFSLIAISVLVYDHFVRLGDVAVALAGAALAVAAIRAARTLTEYVALLATTRDEATTDALTRLGNRRALMDELDARVRVGRSFCLVLLDLDGFKSYNDAFGHSAGDDLLRRLADRLGRALPEDGSAYRLGGDEFCVLISEYEGRYSETITRLQEALSENGDGFIVTSSIGFVRVPQESDDVRTVLTLADRRMYTDKARKARSGAKQTSDALLSALAERQPNLDRHLREVAALAQQVGRHMGLASEELDAVVRAAELHDVGKLAIPDTILNKPGPLTDDEWEFMRNHTIIGERILICAPALLPVATLVRSSHERWDGRGYPDQLGGEEIPLGSRIVFACDAFNAMTSGRPYASAMSRDEVLDEFARCSGTQFDPTVVAALTAVVKQKMHNFFAFDDDLIRTPVLAE